MRSHDNRVLPRSAPALPSFFATVLALAASGAAFGQSATLAVPGTGNPWLAGMPDGSQASGDSAPAESPALVPFAIAPGGRLTFPAVTGMTGYGPGISCEAEGCPYAGLCHGGGAENGVGNVCWGVANCLTGVFLGGDRPDLTPAPATLDFNPDGARGFATLSPGLKQVFFIGDGRTTAGGPLQVFVAPAGATRLFLGSADGSGWYNNVGVFITTVDQAGGLPPCPADFDGSGEVNGNDVSAYLNAWYADLVTGTTAADYNGDGETNGNDISDYINSWYAAVVNGGSC